VRIVQYHPRAAAGDGGITNSVRRLSAGFAHTGAEAIIVSDADRPAPADPGVEWRQVRHRRLGPFFLPDSLDEAFEGADHLILNSAWTAHNVMAGRAARRLRIPYVLAPRGAYDPLIVRRRQLMKRVWWKAWEGELVRDAAAVHVFFRSQDEHLLALGYTGPVVVAPNGVAAPSDAHWTGAGGFLLYLGRFDPEHKGLDLLVRAVAEAPSGTLPPLRMHGPDWRGGKPRLAALIRELGVGDRVELGEPVLGRAKYDLMAEATGFVYPSRWEGFGNSPAEAAAVGVPTLVTPYALGLYLAERDAAVLAPPTVAGLGEGLRRLVDPAARRVGERGRQLVREEFSWDAVARSWMDQLGATP
jgi:glycosyltransferase involved in cell wall biosynthesis